jgi:fatty-acyl-CoA synthase
MSTSTTSPASAHSTDAASIVSGDALSAEPGLGALTIPGYLHEVTSRFSAREALVLRTADSVVRWSYSELWERSMEVARSLLAAGTGKGARVGVLMSNRPELLSAVFGIALAGGVSVVLSTFSTLLELQHLLQVSGVSTLLFEGRVLKKDFSQVFTELEPAVQTAEPGRLLSTKFPFLRRLVRVDAAGFGVREAGAIESWPAFLRHGSVTPAMLVDATAATVKPADVGVLFFSSGTTGLPKGILHTQRAAAIQWWRWPGVLSVSEDVRCWTANGFFWSGQFSMVIGCALSCGGSIVLQPTFDPREALELMQQERVTIPLAWPHQWAKLEGASNWNAVDLSSLRQVDTRTPLGRHPTVRPSGWYDPPAYGATETLTIVAALPNFNPTAQKAHIQGPPLPGNTLKIVDPLTRSVLPRGQRGEIAVKGPTLMLGYIGIPADETLDADGFLHTLDSGYIDEAGQLFWEGRLSDIIKTGGANVSPREVDAILASYPGVKLSRTVGVPHETLGEMVVACIVPHEGAALDETLLRDFLKEQLASYKVPRRLLLFRDEEIAMTGSDKVKADALVKLATARV